MRGGGRATAANGADNQVQSKIGEGRGSKMTVRLVVAERASRRASFALVRVVRHSAVVRRRGGRPPPPSSCSPLGGEGCKRIELDDVGAQVAESSLEKLRDGSDRDDEEGK